LPSAYTALGIVFVLVVASLLIAFTVELSTKESTAVLALLPDSHICTKAGALVLHVENDGSVGIAFTKFEILELGRVELYVKDVASLSGNGIWIDRDQQVIGLDIGGVGYIALDLGNYTEAVKPGNEYTVITHTRDHGIAKIRLRAD